jgi:hypothetical protein
MRWATVGEFTHRAEGARPVAGNLTGSAGYAAGTESRKGCGAGCEEKEGEEVIAPAGWQRLASGRPRG